ncbi:MAG: MarR family transcriptional regulator [Propionibacteriales bacterium]|nr:MarR family transcriptional regulator [Propionibacteriales bacterium]
MYLGGSVKRQESFGYQVNHLARSLAQELRTRTLPHGVVPGQFAQLLALFERDRVTQSELREQVRIDQSTMAHTLKRMERDELVERIPDPDDGRRALIVLTPRARALEDVLVQAAEETNAIATAHFTDAEKQTLMGLIARAITNLEAAQTGAPNKEQGS